MKAIVDASNVAHYGKVKDGKPILENILNAVKALTATYLTQQLTFSMPKVTGS
ncbi:MAG: hypothetical protein K8E24_004560 [Methanobacterium paludis]|nr:hypothetical protein [Methanobacterium paludis]